MTRTEIDAALANYEAANIVWADACNAFNASRDHFMAIPGKATKADFAEFAAAQAAFAEAKRVINAIGDALEDLPETADDDDSASQMVLL